MLFIKILKNKRDVQFVTKNKQGKITWLTTIEKVNRSEISGEINKCENNNNTVCYAKCIYYIRAQDIAICRNRRHSSSVQKHRHNSGQT